MTILSGRCTLIVDGKRHPGVSFALELVKDPLRRGFGFLSGPGEVLKSTQSAKHVQIRLDSGQIFQVRILIAARSDLPLILIAHNAQQLDTESPPDSADSGPPELTTIDKLRALIEDHLKAEGFLNTSVTVQADLDKARAGMWDVKNFAGEDNEAEVKGALDRLIPELQKRLRI